MNTIKKIYFSTFIALLFIQAPAVKALDFSASLGHTGQSQWTARLGLSQDWDKHWLESKHGQLTGYWDGAYTYWESGNKAGVRHSVSFSPVFVYEFKGDKYKPYLEAGIGAAFFSKTNVGDRKISTSFNFEDRLGFGVKFASGQSVGFRVLHYSNFGIKKPNDGIESYNLYYKMPF